MKSESHSRKTKRPRRRSLSLPLWVVSFFADQAAILISGRIWTGIPSHTFARAFLTTFPPGSFHN